MGNGSKQYTWHPAVHKEHQELLYYYALKIRPQPGQTLESVVSDVTSRAGARCSCSYIVYGRWDVLLRVWLNRFGRDRLNDVLRDPLQQVVSVSSFVARSIEYRWTGINQDLLGESQRVLAGRVLALKNQIDAIVQRDRDVRLDADEATELAELVFARNPPVTGAVKAYAILRFPEGVDADSYAIERIIEVARGLDKSFEASIYVGEGRLADVLVKVVAPEFARVAEATSVLGEVADTVRASIETVLIASSIGIESDNVNELEIIHDSDVPVLDALRIETAIDREKYLKLEAEQKRVLRDVTLDALAKAGTGIEAEDIKTFIKGSALQDVRLVRQGAGFLPDVETYLADYLRPLWGSILGDNWVPRVRALAEAAAAESAKHDAGPDGDDGHDLRWLTTITGDVKYWTFGSYLGLAEVVARADQYVAARMRADLGEDWSRRLRAGRDIRNDYSHGRLTRGMSGPLFSELWTRRVYVLAETAALMDRLRSRASGTPRSIPDELRTTPAGEG